MNGLLQKVRYALRGLLGILSQLKLGVSYDGSVQAIRTLLRSPGFALAGALSLALAIAANTVAFEY